MKILTASHIATTDNAVAAEKNGSWEKTLFLHATYLTFLSLIMNY